MNDRDKLTVSKFMSLVLRHAPAKAEVTLDKNGWADVKELINGINSVRKTNITLDDLKEIAAACDKQRYKFNDTYTKIRANQGHSVPVDAELKEAEPLAILYHGTATRYIDAILKDGLIAKSRLYVHLSADTDTAVNVGKRHGEPVILAVNAAKMHADGYKFYLSENAVWLTERVPAEYIKVESCT
jgi:putative RNA 2'-phosphotransferase